MSGSEVIADKGPAPVVIGATGGSGTRVVARIVRRLGIFLGTNLNDSEDTAELFEFYDRWINRYTLRDVAPLCAEEEHLLAYDFAACIHRHRRGLPAPDAPWGWKEPRSIYLLPFLGRTWPELKFIHVVRDGRDMALSSNQNQLRKHGEAVLRGALGDGLPPVRSAALWARVNRTAAAFGREHLAGRYLCVRFETLCTQPYETVARIAGFLCCERPGLEACVREVAAPDSLGRWRNADGTLQHSIGEQVGAALAEFGYL